MANVKLQNATRNRMLVFNLEHPVFVQQPGANGVGKPESLTILAGETVEIDEAALACAEVKAALRRGKGGLPAPLKVVG